MKFKTFNKIYAEDGAKPFDRKLFEENDLRGREAVKGHLGAECVDNPDLYGPDLRIGDLWVEVDICRSWVDEYPYQTVTLPKRKGKWRHLNIEFWRLSNDLSKVIIIPGNKIKEKNLVEIPNKYISSGELFYQISLDDVRIERIKK